MKVYRDQRDNTYWAEWGHDYVTRVVTLMPAVQDAGTGRWAHQLDYQHQRGVTEAELAERYTAVPREPERDPRITRLAVLVEQLLAEHAAATGCPAEVEEELRAALAVVQGLPEEWSRKRLAAGVAGARAAARSAHRR